MKLHEDLVIKSSVFEKEKYFETHIYKIIDEVFASNNAKNKSLGRFETVLNTYPYNDGSMEVYNTGLAVLRIRESPRFSYIYQIDESYLSKYELLRFSDGTNNMVLTVFNNILVLNTKDSRPIYFSDDPKVVKRIFKKAYYEGDIKKHLQSVSEDNVVIYSLEAVPECLYLHDINRDKINRITLHVL